MKFLHLLGSVYRDWFSPRKDLKFTACVMLMFFISSFLFLYIAASMGRDILWNSEQEYSASLCVNTLGFPSESAINALTSLSDNKPTNIQVDATITIQKLNDKENIEQKILPIYSSSVDTSALSCTYSVGGLVYDMAYTKLPEITDGRGITDSDIKNESKVIALPENLGAEVGDKITLCNEPLEVVGLCSGAFAMAASSVLDKFATQFANEQYIVAYDTWSTSFSYIIGNVNSVQFESPVTDEQISAISSNAGENFNVEKAELPTGYEFLYLVTMAILGPLIALFAVVCIYYSALRLCAGTMPLLSLLKLVGMRPRRSFFILFIPLMSCLAVSFGAACGVIFLTSDFFSQMLVRYELHSISFAVTAVIMLLAVLIAMLPPILKMARSQPVQNKYL